MAKVLLAWELGGGAGHCVKLAPIARGLLERGHKVSVAARDLVTARQVFGPLPVDYFQSPYLPGRNSRAPTRSFADILQATGFGEDASIEVLLNAWRNLFSAVQADMLICDHAPMALFAGLWHSMRRVVVGTGFTVPPPLSPLPDLRYWTAGAATVEELRQAEDLIVVRVNRLLTRDRLQPLACLADLYVDVDLSVLLTFRELDHYPQREAANYWGAWTRGGGCTPEWPANGPRLFAYLKPPSPVWKLDSFLGFLCESGIASVVYVPGCDARWLREFQTQQLRFVESPVDVAHAARQCDVAVLNGTAGSLTALLLAGVPQLNIPLYLEQMILSRRVSDLGAGLIANPSRPLEFAARLTALLRDDRHRQAAVGFAKRYANYNESAAKEQIISAINDKVASASG